MTRCGEDFFSELTLHDDADAGEIPRMAPSGRRVQRSQDERPDIRQVFAGELAKAGLTPAMDGVYAAELPDLPPVPVPAGPVATSAAAR